MTEKVLSSTLKLLDETKNLQIFNGPNSEPLSSLVIKKDKQLGGGSQADVY